MLILIFLLAYLMIGTICAFIMRFEAGSEAENILLLFLILAWPVLVPAFLITPLVEKLLGWIIKTADRAAVAHSRRAKRDVYFRED